MHNLLKRAMELEAEMAALSGEAKEKERC